MTLRHYFFLQDYKRNVENLPFYKNQATLQ
ncbi:hypothetical protein B6A09_1285 [Saccharomyces cerevisiae synthetic construct]|uniref:Putative uncharacterized protein YBR131C-A n=2 Tax=Saccharomyces cerevisiae TaxID=4932 RepID=YB131_YEAST|nr:RecName: Full=Putative uncharacterized protein YBR131C-A [Saccharomyces cerevisiae S288C]AAL79246.1 unknown [Saccharomyces cerevisiae]ARB01932.1 hypothetical protein B6A09_1285 [Saccharomyces cerevisiae synthetic construct]WNV72028.1 hypothetical protein O6U65_0272 [Saccharomyces cerevisiae synthetic construct]CBK39205.1 EC1118_1B15_2861p [Saccharomyces cerevisiae EC1118]